ncbi:succinylglutamate desuccinylase/aspartoacylase family protein [Primorskyibacter sp. S87]|uniref:succinylglutamate desuccinylase/aspartoacylase family protein n=1 Tax=Primorskyibacter sp. S87 TaxID=3415126 RepID=UPI003C7A9BF2
MAATLITSEVDLDANGKQAGYLRVPHSVDRSAYGWIGLPIVSIKNGAGPTMLMLAGVHGDEYEGQIALTKLSRELEPQDIDGQLIILTMANYPAARASRRVSPIDEGNLNRSFPGNAMGAPTQMIAHYIEEVLLPRSDYMVDLHSGGTSLFYPATLLRGMGATEEERAKLQLLEHAFDLPFAWVFGGGGRQSTGRTALAAANRNGVVSVMAELGGGGGIDRTILADAERGLRRVLHKLKMLPGYQPDGTRGTRALSVQGSVYCYDDGVFEPFKDIADPVSPHEALGQIHFPDQPQREPAHVVSPFGGIVLAKRTLSHVQRGDAVYQIADDIQEN